MGIVCKRKSPLLPHPPLRSRSLLPQRGNTPSGSEVPSCLPSPPSNRCGSPPRVRRVRPIHCPQEVLLISLLIYCCNCWHFNCLIDLFLHCHLIVIDSMFTCL